MQVMALFAVFIAVEDGIRQERSDRRLPFIQNAQGSTTPAARSRGLQLPVWRRASHVLNAPPCQFPEFAHPFLRPGARASSARRGVRRS